MRAFIRAAAIAAVLLASGLTSTSQATVSISSYANLSTTSGGDYKSVSKSAPMSLATGVTAAAGTGRAEFSGSANSSPSTIRGRATAQLGSNGEYVFLSGNIEVGNRLVLFGNPIFVLVDPDGFDNCSSRPSTCGKIVNAASLPAGGVPVTLTGLLTGSLALTGNAQASITALLGNTAYTSGLLTGSQSINVPFTFTTTITTANLSTFSVPLRLGMGVDLNGPNTSADLDLSSTFKITGVSLAQGYFLVDEAGQVVAPVPPAAALLISALVGLGGLARARSTARARA